MAQLKLKLLTTEFTNILYAFEKENALFWEQTTHPRPEVYRDVAKLNVLIEEQMFEIEQGEHLLFLIFDEDNKLVGRINVTDFSLKEEGLVADLGYRIGKKYSGKGYATEAVKLVKQYLKKNNLCQVLYAGAALDNYGSIVVLVKNHFQMIHVIENSDGSIGPSDRYVELRCEI